MYNILIVGHGTFATGIKSSLDLLIGECDRIHAQNLSENITHEEFENIITEYLNKYDKLIVFADLLGGAPSQIVTRKVLEMEKSKEQFVISGVSLALILDICSQIIILNEEENILEKINTSLDNIKDTMSVVCLEDFCNDESKEESYDLQDIIGI
ncbi:PTS system mannose/fructose/sorbose family transporter subunit IIA [Clostridium putrefaciens]|uniref:PTS system mannose/fructose/sorbose family transporter subunit IIA n=1 Tax=Clostridium putrefaciens TaxID=99675 RepID=A0A381J524_9CLOT|nr:PTS mannose transporter subunit IID [Clostridium putrefaciens]SUY46304.1 PTS system mannose/fructose/sorbose family transporter subunit IIA [Clostridium putrefaciens]